MLLIIWITNNYLNFSSTYCESRYDNEVIRSFELESFEVAAPVVHPVDEK